MAIKTDFEKLEILYTSINDLNKVLNDKDSDTRIDDLFNCIKEVDKSEFSSEIQDAIIKSFIEAVTKIYKEESIRLNSNIGVSFDNEDYQLYPINKKDFIPPLHLQKNNIGTKSPIMTDKGGLISNE